MHNPVVSRGKKRSQAGVVPVHNKESDGKARRSLLGPRQVGTVPQHQDPRNTMHRKPREAGKIEQERMLSSRLGTLQHGDDPNRHHVSAHEIMELRPVRKMTVVAFFLSKIASVVGFVYAWTATYNKLILHVLPDNSYFDVLKGSFWVLMWNYMTHGYATNFIFLKTMVLPTVGWLLSSIVVAILGWRVVLPLLSFMSRPVVWFVNRLFSASGWFSNLMAWRKKVNKPRRAGTGFNDEHEPERIFMDEDPQAAFRDAAIVRRQQEEEEDKNSDDDEEGFSGGGGSVPSGGQSPNAIAAAMSGRSGGNSV